MVFEQEFKSELFNTNDDNFEEKCLKAFHFQYQNNLLYQQYVNHLGVDIHKVDSVGIIPFLPITFFKTHQIVSTSQNYTSYFESSGTTGSRRSRLYFYDEEFYLANAVSIFESRFGSLADYTFFFLLPSYLERKSSSLVSMANRFYHLSDQEFGGFFLYDFTSLAIEINKAQSKNKKVILWGVTFALIDFSNTLESPMKGIMVFETGGMKGRGREPLRSEVHELLRKKLSPKSIHSEYGMTELFSQAYSFDNEMFNCPPQMKVLLRDLEDPLYVHTEIGVRGGINVVDLANIDTCCFIETQDIGLLKNDGFQVLGRFDNSEIRGCNLMVLS